MDLMGENALDVCNGHEAPERGYHDHVTPNRFPYILGGYSGVVEASNNRQLWRMRIRRRVEYRGWRLHVSEAPGCCQRVSATSVSVKPTKSQKRMECMIPSSRDGKLLRSVIRKQGRKFASLRWLFQLARFGGGRRYNP